MFQNQIIVSANKLAPPKFSLTLIAHFTKLQFLCSKLNVTVYQIKNHTHLCHIHQYDQYRVPLPLYGLLCDVAHNCGTYFIRDMSIPLPSSASSSVLSSSSEHTVTHTYSSSSLRSRQLPLVKIHLSTFVHVQTLWKTIVELFCLW